MQVDPSVVCGAISALSTLAVCLVNNKVQHNKTISLIEFKLDELTKQVEKHNSVIERTYELEKTTTLYGEKFDGINRRVDALEKEKKRA